MMRRAAVLFALVLVWAARPVEAAEEAGSMPMQRYEAPAPAAGLAFDYPAGWTAEPSAGLHEPYWQVQVYGPQALESRVRSYLVVRRVPTPPHGGRYADVDALAADYLKTLQPGLMATPSGSVQVAGLEANRMAVHGSLALPWESQHPQLVPVQGERVFFAFGDQLYELGWLTTPDAAPTVAAAFARLLASLQLSSPRSGR